MKDRWRLPRRLKFMIPAALVLIALFSSGRPIARAGAGTSAAHFGDDRFGVTLHGDPQQLPTLGTRWFITGRTSLPPLPPAAVWVQYIRISSQTPLAGDIATRVARWPGSYWLLGNEPNAKGSAGEMTGDQYARSFHNVLGTIKAADATAKIVAPNIINFDFTCIDCPGFTSGHAWMDDFLASYRADYGTAPPIDIWAIHLYPLDFQHFPQVNSTLMADQVRQFRSYLDNQGSRGAGIWITELGTHWGFEGLDWRDDGSGTTKAFPIGAFRDDLLRTYLQNLIGWLATNGPALHVDRWFLYATYVDEPEPWESVYGGINLFDGYGPGAGLTSFGQLYRCLAGLSP